MKAPMLLGVFGLGVCLTADLGAAETAPPPQSQPAPVRLIFDTDLGGDCDDAGALAMLHALADAGEAQLLAVVVNGGDDQGASAAAVDAINTYYGRPNIPIGASKRIPPRPFSRSEYTAALRDEFPNDIGSDSAAPDALAVYRRTLAAQPDGSVVICSVGAFTNLRDLLESRPDDLTPLSGRELVRRKVRQCVVMAGRFPRSSQSDWNTHLDVGAAVTFVNDWPTPVLWTGGEVGERILTGRQLQATPEANPVRRAYALHGRSFGQASIEQGRPSWDQTAVLLAVRGAQPEYWKVVQGGRVVLDSDALTVWRTDRDSNHRYVELTSEPAKLATVIGELMARLPRRAH